MVERNLAKVEVESSRLFSRSKFREDIASRLIRHITGRVSCSKITSGEVAKRLCSGLQSRLDGFDSRPRLQKLSSKIKDLAHFSVGYFFAWSPRKFNKIRTQPPEMGGYPPVE